VQRTVILPSFESLEEDLARTDMERVNRSLDNEIGQLLLFCADWGNWLETYRYMAARTRLHRRQHDAGDARGGMLDAVAYLDGDGRFVWRRGFDPVTRAEASYAMFAGEALDPATRSAAQSPRARRRAAWCSPSTGRR